MSYTTYVLTALWHPMSSHTSSRDPIQGLDEHAHVISINIA
jgi:hypothetical protein